ncbi:hypothetical protein HQ884_13485 [Enterococcus faecium]|nr:hypothetical protein [Enterococcus faecium]EGP5366373.1 hypothetical protein [Enterococcus faecium]NTQ55436.1 hypothetical protein [Enterococcus faecium]
MAKMLSVRDFDLAAIGTLFEVDEVMPKFATEERKDSSGTIILDNEGRPRRFSTAEIVGYKYSVTILDGNFRKKSTQVTVDGLRQVITNEEIRKKDSVKCRFSNLTVSMSGNPMYYKADDIVLLPQENMKK